MLLSCDYHHNVTWYTDRALLQISQGLKICRIEDNFILFYYSFTKVIDQQF
jgi:hypothetical protein